MRAEIHVEHAGPAFPASRLKPRHGGQAGATMATVQVKSAGKMPAVREAAAVTR